MSARNCALEERKKLGGGGGVQRAHSFLKLVLLIYIIRSVISFSLCFLVKLCDLTGKFSRHWWPKHWYWGIQVYVGSQQGAFYAGIPGAHDSLSTPTLERQSQGYAGTKLLTTGGQLLTVMMTRLRSLFYINLGFLTCMNTHVVIICSHQKREMC